MTAHITDKKARLRVKLLCNRRALTPEIKSDADRIMTERLLSLSEFADAETVFCYVSMYDEPSTSELINEILRSGKTLLVPRCMAEGHMDAVRILSPDELRPSGKFGIMEPDMSAPAWSEAVDFAVVPALACSRRLYRLGRGGGYYDRFIAEHTEMFSAALCYEIRDVPAETYDMQVNAAITPNELIIRQ